jgi:CBS domain-containing protein
MASHLQGVALHESRVASAMAREVRCCLPSDSPVTVQTLMQHHKIRRVPVVDAERRLVGIVSLGDLAYLMGVEQAQGDGLTWTALAHTLSAVSSPRLPRYRR